MPRVKNALSRTKREMDVKSKEYINPFKKSGDSIPIPSIVGTLLKHEKKDKEKIEKLEKILKERKKKLSQKDN